MKPLLSAWLVCVFFIPLLSRGQQISPPLCVITYNLKSGQGYGEPDGKNPVERFRLIGEEIGKYAPDVLVIQEPGSTPALYDTLVAAMGSQYRYQTLKCPDYQDNRRVGLLVVSPRVTIDSIDNCIQGDGPEATHLFNHWARISLAFQGYPLVVYGFKLAPRHRRETRRRQINLLEPYLEKDITDHWAIIVAGDLNHRPFDVEYRRWMSLGLTDSFDSLAQGDGFTKMDELGEDILVPYRRIDYLLISPELARRLKVSSQVLHENLFVPDPPSRRWSLSDHLPMMAVFEIP